MTNQKVIDSWSIRVIPPVNIGAKLWYDSNMVLYSYELPIARLSYPISDPTEVISPEGQTTTTKKHIRMAMERLEERHVYYNVVDKITL